MCSATPIRKLVVGLALVVWFVPGAGAQASKATKAAKPPKTKRAPAAAAKKVLEEAPIRRRDPFEPLVGRGGGGGEVPANLPPGKAGLVASTVRLDGLVRAPSGMIAVVANPQQRVYFLREGDQIYNGRVERITMDGITFQEQAKDAFGKPLERLVTKRLYPSAGEQR